MGMSYEYQDYLLDLVNELGLCAQMARIKGKTPADEWRTLELLVVEELEERNLAYDPPEEKTEDP